MKDLENRIKYLKQELAARDRQDGWIVEGLRKELERLLKKAVKTK